MKKALFFLLWLASISTLLGQDVPQVTNKVFIENVHINVRPGQAASFGNILIEDGMITQVGNAITAPYDAKVVKGDSMHIYAGFIAPLSHAGIEKPKESSERPKVERSGYPPNDVAGITPEKSISNLYKKDQRSIGDFRKAGFTIAHSVPYGRMMPGMGSVISLSGEDFYGAAVKQDHSMFATWTTANRIFPATLIGIMSKWRELYRNAELAHKHSVDYAANPANRKRPSPDAATAALFPVINKKMPVFFMAEKHRDVARTIQLQKDLGFNLVLCEARDIDRILNHAKKSNAQILLSLDLPKEEKKPSAKADGKEEKEEGPSAEADGKEQSGSDKKKEQLQKRKEESIARYISQAKKLSSAGIPVSFSYIDTKPKDIHANLKRLVKDGLTESDALGALTTRAAATLGISNIAGTIESGKIGNLVLTTESLFDEKSKIKMVIVDGKIHEYEIKEKKKKAEGEGEAIDPSGDWSYTIEIPGMASSGTIKFINTGDGYELEITNEQAPGEVIKATDVELIGNNMTYVFSPNMGGMNIAIQNDITFDEDTFEGTVDVGDFGTFEITGQKSSPE